MNPEHPGGDNPGRLLVAERVVAKIAAIAAADVEAVGGPPPRAATRVAAFLRDGSPGGRPRPGWRGAGWRRAGHGGARRRPGTGHGARPGDGPGDRPGGRPEVTARVVDGAAWVSLTLSIAYPAPVSQTAQAVRDRVRERVAALAGLPVARIDIDIPLLSAGVGCSGAGR
ncbi:Asp23/Gls24 family envelope stress response protein [Parafrankia discariae]|uniref:Asp23/Gls24 family envelope stress response protein n=1 Tax=Parafrankia discariae TaxID=365528 RepID=UPI00037E98E5|nr:Asp23/Gls24 family envelope stress response protein [Parafrankia discariae]